jgi:hypothetical protein
LARKSLFERDILRTGSLDQHTEFLQMGIGPYDLDVPRPEKLMLRLRPSARPSQVPQTRELLGSNADVPTGRLSDQATKRLAWFGLASPNSMPPDIGKLNKEIKAMLAI